MENKQENKQENKIYKVGILISYPDIFYDINGNLTGMTYIIWKYIKDKLKRYKFKEYMVDNINWDKQIDKLNKGDYDFIIGNFVITRKRLRKVNFSLPIGYISSIIIYDPHVNSQLNYKKFFLETMKFWFIPIIVIILFSASFSYFEFKYSKIKNIYRIMLNSFLSFTINKNLFINDTNYKFIYIIHLILVLFVIYFIFFFSVKNSKNILKQVNKVNDDIQGMSFYTPKGGYSVELLRQKGAIPIEVKDSYMEYQKNRYSQDINGFVFSDINVDKILLKNPNYEISHAISGYNPLAFPINKKNVIILEELNKVISFMKKKGLLFKSCYNFINNELIIC